MRKRQNSELFLYIILTIFILLPLLVYGAGRTSFRGQVYTPPVFLAPTGITQAIDFNESNIVFLDLGDASGNVTVSFSNPAAGAVYVIAITQSATARTITWPAEVKWQDNTPVVLSTTNDYIDIVTCVYNGTSYFCNAANNYQ